MVDSVFPAVRDEVSAKPARNSALTELVRAAMAGDRAAFASLYDDFEPTLRSIALSRVPGDVADDLVHDAFVTALQKLPSLRDPAAFAGWITSIARNRVAEHLRRAPIAIDPTPAYDASNEELEAQSVLRVIHTLPEAYAEPLVLRFVDG